MPHNPSADITGLGLRAPLIGRHEPLRVLLETADKVRAGQTRITSIVGPPGIGKTRLASDFAFELQQPAGGFRHVYRSLGRSSATSHGLFGRLLRSRFGLFEGTSDAEAWARLRREVSQVIAERDVDDVCYFLAQLLDVAAPKASLARVLADEPAEAGLLRRVVLRRYFESESQQSPVCIVADDIDSADADSLDLLIYLMRNLQGPVFVVCLTRPEIVAREPNWFDIGGERHSRLDLPPMSESDSSQLLEMLLAPCQGGPPEPLIEAAASLAGGNPGLLEQMVRLFHDVGVLTVDAQHVRGRPTWKVAVEKLANVRLPMNAQDAVAARMAALEASDQRLLTHAAAIGNVFWLKCLVSLDRFERDVPEVWNPSDTQDVATVRSMLEDLERRDYVLRMPESLFAGDEEYVFKQNLEREYLLRLTHAGSLRRYHQTIADWLNLHENVRVQEETCAMLAQHLERAGSTTRAGLAYLDAADLARGAYANKKAVEYYGKGLEILADADAFRRMNALHNYGDVLLALGRAEEALASFREMHRLAYVLNCMGKGGAAQNRIGRLYRDTGALQLARKHLDAGLALFTTDADQRGIAASHDDIGQLLWVQGQYDEALSSMSIALEMRRTFGDERSIALSLNNMGLVWMDHGDMHKARKAFEASLDLRRKNSDRLGISESLTNLGCLEQDRNNWEGALRRFEEAYTWADQVGERNQLAVLLTHIGTTHYHLGDVARAIQVFQQAEELCDELGNRLQLAEAWRGLAKAFLLQGDLKRARENVKRAVDMFGQVRSKPHLAIGLRTLAEVTAGGAWGPGHEEKVLDYFTRSINLSKELGNELEVARSYQAFSRFALENPYYQSNPDILREAKKLQEMAEEIFERHRRQLESSSQHKIETTL
jgi:tetratricopeptide (TPR) repeat protein